MNDETRNAQIARHDEVRRLACQSWMIHPDWEAEEHLAFMADEIGLDPEEPLTVVAWPGGPSTAAAEKYVEMWLRHPARCFEGVR